MRIWFWAWVIVAVVAAAMSAVARDRRVAPWAAGAAAAAALEAVRVSPGWQWAAFFATSAGLYLALERRPRYRGRHVRGH